MLIHVIPAEKGFENLNASSKLNAEWEFFIHLHDIGHKASDEWLQANFDAIGQQSTLDLRAQIH